MHNVHFMFVSGDDSAFLMLEGAVVPKTARKALMFDHALVDEIRLTKSKAKKEEHKRIMSNLVRGNILKWYRLVRHAKGSGVPLSKKRQLKRK